MPQWEYVIHRFEAIDMEQPEFFLAEMGKAGWELATVAPDRHADWLRYIFKRPRQEQPGAGAPDDALAALRRFVEDARDEQVKKMRVAEAVSDVKAHIVHRAEMNAYDNILKEIERLREGAQP